MQQGNYLIGFFARDVYFKGEVGVEFIYNVCVRRTVIQKIVWLVVVQMGFTGKLVATF